MASPGHYRVTDKILQIEFDGEKTDYTMLQVRTDFGE
jgi:vacuolar-type H+-ATPase catalytic subunit A/Vma1